MLGVVLPTRCIGMWGHRPSLDVFICAFFLLFLFVFLLFFGLVDLAVPIMAGLCDL